MTTDDAKELIKNAYNKNIITKDCARYFIDLIVKHSFYMIGEEKVLYKSINGVLTNIGLYYDRSGFSAIDYIKKTSYPYGLKQNNDTAYLANIINFDLSSVLTNIEQYMKCWPNCSLKSLKHFKDYLDGTSYLCASNYNENIKQETINVIKNKLNNKIHALEQIHKHTPRYAVDL